MRKAFATCALFLLLGCHESGTWVDDPGNFKRAWGVDPPGGVAVMRSWYWRSAHFTREEIYYFQLRSDLAYAEAFAARNGVALHDPGDLESFSFMSPKPSWFASKDIARYKIWSTGSELPSCIVLFDPASGDIFIHVAQL